MSVILNNKQQRFATEGFRAIRHNSDGTIASPQRFVGFANTTNLSRILVDGKASLTIKIDAEPSVTKEIDFSNVLNPNRVTVQDAIDALTAADFPLVEWTADPYTGRLKGAFSMGIPATFTVELTTDVAHNLPAGTYSLFYNGNSFLSVVDTPIAVLADDPILLEFTASIVGEQPLIPVPGQSVNLSTFTPSLPGTLTDWSGEFVEVTQGSNPALTAKVVQVVGPLAAALDFGQGVKYGGNGLECLSYFGNETISIMLPKDIKDREEIDNESAKGVVTRMIIGAKILGKSPVIAVKKKDYYLLELIQGGQLDREKNTYNPPLSGESGFPSFSVEIFSPTYSKDSNTLGDYTGFERIMLRSVTGLEGDVPIEAKAWAQYAYNCTAVGYTDENGNEFPAWEEGPLTVEQFDALRLNELVVTVSENLSASESR